MSTVARCSHRPATVSRESARPSEPVEADAVPGPAEVFVRGVTPPKPLAAILAVLQAMPAGREQYVRTELHPADLLHALEQRGIEARSAPMPDGTWRTRLVRPAEIPLSGGHAAAAR